VQQVNRCDDEQQPYHDCPDRPLGERNRLSTPNTLNARVSIAAKPGESPLRGSPFNVGAATMKAKGGSTRRQGPGAPTQAHERTAF